VEATKRDKEAQPVVSSQNHKPSFIPHPKPINPTAPSTPLKIQKLTRAEMVEHQLKGLCYNPQANRLHQAPKGHHFG
jgi:hypothetical protein